MAGKNPPREPDSDDEGFVEAPKPGIEVERERAGVARDRRKPAPGEILLPPD